MSGAGRRHWRTVVLVLAAAALLTCTAFSLRLTIADALGRLVPSDLPMDASPWSESWLLAEARLRLAVALSGRDPRHLESLAMLRARQGDRLLALNDPPHAWAAYREAKSLLLETAERRPNWPAALVRAIVVKAKLYEFDAQMKELIARALVLGPQESGVQMGVARTVLDNPFAFGADLRLVALRQVGAGLGSADWKQRDLMARYVKTRGLAPALCAQGLLDGPLRKKWCAASVRDSADSAGTDGGD